jgi:aryl-phospho-beta-D-glucosidase BglC (GH1 family)
VSINSGGPATGSFTADQYFSGGSTYTNTRTIDVSQIPANTAPAAIFSTERYGAITYTIPNRAGTQTVTLYFVETYVTAAGQRVFNVSINGATVLSRFDIFATAGGANRAIARSFTTTANGSGQVVIQLTAVTQNPKISGLTVSGGGTPPVTTPPVTTPPVTTPPVTTPPVTTPPNGVVWRVDAQGNITRNGVIFRVKGGSWFGLQGRYEIATDPTNPRGAPMEQYMGNVFWAPSGRTYAQDVTEMKNLGINLVRLPLVHQTLDNNDAQGRDPNLKNDTSVRIQGSRTALAAVIRALDAGGIEVLLDIHSCSNYVDWRKGRLDARPPWADATRENYDFKREDSSCAATGNPSTVTRIQAYNTTLWLQDLRTLAGLNAELGVDNVMGIDIYNEPHDYTWAEWKSLSEQAYTAINAVNPNILIFVEGIGTKPGTQDGTPETFTEEPHGDLASNPNWGENLYSAGTNPLTIPKDRVVFSPHTYGPSVFVQKMFMDPAQTACAGLEGDAAAALDCRIVINSTLLRQGWQEHFGYLKAQGYAVVIGEYGGNMQWPGPTASLRDQQMWSHITDQTIDAQWQNAFVDYLISAGIRDSIYWSINPESGDTGGIFTSPFRPGSNEAGWGTWGALDSAKVTLLRRLWGN